MPSLVQVELRSNGAASLVLNRPQQRNALSIQLLDEVCTSLEDLSRQAEQRVVILRAAGPVFSAGLDLREALDESLVERSAAMVERALHLLRTTPLVVIAAVHGGAYAGGAGLVAACDIVVAAEDAQFGFPEARRGLLPALISDVLRTRIREGDLRDLLLTGEPISATRALQMGLVQRVVPADQLLEEAERVADNVLAGGPETIRQTKHLIHRLYDTPTGLSREEFAGLHLAARQGEEAREGLTAFVEKRPPKWSRSERERST